MNESHEIPKIEEIYTTLPLKITLKWLLRHNGFKVQKIKELPVITSDKRYTPYSLSGKEHGKPAVYYIYVDNHAEVRKRRC